MGGKGLAVAQMLHRHAVRSVSLGDRTALRDGALTVDAVALRADLLTGDERLAEISVTLAQPGEATRVVCVKDVVQPRLVQEGSIDVLDGVAVATCGPIVGFQEGIIDMSGPGADYTPFSAMPLIVLQIGVQGGLGPHEHEAAVREAGLMAAEMIAKSCEGLPPDAAESLARENLLAGSGLPRFAYVYMVLSQGLLHDTYVQGRNAKDGLPVVMDPGAVFANGIVSGNCVSACDKNTTFHHQNNPVIAELLRGHGKRWDFAGVVVTNQLIRLADKQRSAEAAIGLVLDMKVDGAVVSKEGFGNPDADLMMILSRLEQGGIKAVAITDEFAGIEGESQSLADTAPEADAIVSTGNANARIVLPAMTTTIGPLPNVSRLAGGYPHTLREDGSLEVELQAIVGATNQLGYGRLSCREV